jgi:hypothetical protein
MKENRGGGTCDTHGEKRDAYRVLVWKLEVLNPLGKVVYVWIILKWFLKRQVRRECTRFT